MPSWLIAGTDTAQPYPCRCRPSGDCDAAWCPCAGRDDAEATPARCCARRFGPADVAAARRASNARRSARRTATRSDD